MKVPYNDLKKTTKTLFWEEKAAYDQSAGHHRQGGSSDPEDELLSWQEARFSAFESVPSEPPERRQYSWGYGVSGLESSSRELGDSEEEKQVEAAHESGEEREPADFFGARLC